MIYLGLADDAKRDVVSRYCTEHRVRKVFVLAPKRLRSEFILAASVEHVEWAEIIQYKFFYRLLQEIDRDTLVVINECLRTQNRYDLTYNCIRHFLNQTGHQMVFQYLPLIDSPDDFMILFDFDTRNRWKREKLRQDLLEEALIETACVPISLRRVDVPTTNQLRDSYQREKDRLITNIGLKDPHTIPRNLYLLSGKAKLKYVEQSPLFGESYYVGRNNRFKIPTLQTYKEPAYPNRYTVFEFCHKFIDWVDFLSLSRQTDFDVLVADLKVDHWYFQRFMTWLENLQNAYSVLQRQEERVGCGA